MNDAKRNVGLDLLRIVSMTMIVGMHWFLGGYLNDTNEFAFNWYSAWLFEAAFHVAVNCFVLISGFYYDKMTGSIKKALVICKQVWLYSLIIAFIVAMICGGLSKSEIIYALFPITTKRYWFINVYIGLLLLSPYINKIICNIDKEQHKRMIIIGLLLFSIPQTILLSEEWTLDSTSGYGIIWFVVLYITASYIRKYGTGRLTRRWCIYTYFLCIMLIFASKVIISIVDDKVPFLVGYSNWFYRYNNIFVFVASVMIFVWFENLTFRSWKSERIITFAAGSVLPVFILHANHIIGNRRIVWDMILHTSYWRNSPWLVVVAIGESFGIVCMCIILDKVRKYMGDKLIVFVRK